MSYDDDEPMCVSCGEVLPYERVYESGMLTSYSCMYEDCVRQFCDRCFKKEANLSIIGIKCHEHFQPDDIVKCNYCCGQIVGVERLTDAFCDNEHSCNECYHDRNEPNRTKKKIAETARTLNALTAPRELRDIIIHLAFNLDYKSFMF